MKQYSEKYKDYSRSILLGAFAGIGLALVFSAGFFMRDVVDIPRVLAFPAATETEGYSLLDEVQILLDQHYLREQPDYALRQYAAIRGVLSSLQDRGTFFIEPPVARSESDVLAGTYGGIGVSIQRNAAGEFVLYPFPDGPAARAGIQDGDILKIINGTILEMSVQQDAVDQMLRGEVKDDNGVEIVIGRDGAEIGLFILFDIINVPSVLWRVLADDERIGYIQILRFTSRTPDEVAMALQELSTNDIGAIVLDLRNNSGGLLQEAIEVASIFLDGGVILYEKTRNGERAFEAEDEGRASEIPMAVLVNQGTASAAELVAGAVQDHDRGILIGQTTFGKGTIQQIFQLSDQSSIHITSAEWFTPDRKTLDGVGITPNIPMIPDINGRDVEIGEAIRYLQDQIGAQSNTQ
jgi:carboxyl-terminal processing protease